MVLESLNCYRCGASLAKLTLPLSRLDQCPDCLVDVHVCRMCLYYDPCVAESCTEDDALEVKDKRKANFCDFFKPRTNAYDPAEIDAARRAEADLAALFGAGPTAQEGSSSPALEAAEELFKK